MNDLLDRHVAELDATAFTVVRHAIEPSCIDRWRGAADQFYARIAESTVLPPPTDYLPQVASGSLPFLEATVGLSVDLVLSAFARSLVLPVVETTFSGPVTCNIEQSWIRRQYAPAHRPRDQFAHAWHQDGALRRTTETVPLKMATCWSPLIDCGLFSPGIELVARRWDRLLEVVELDDSTIQTEIRPSIFRKLKLEAGDVLILLGDALHRTHATSKMAADRTSIELRLFPQNAIPDRLAGNRFLPLSPS